MNDLPPIVSQIFDRGAEQHGILGLALGGSHGAGKPQTDSDVDLFVICSDPVFVELASGELQTLQSWLATDFLAGKPRLVDGYGMGINVRLEPSNLHLDIFFNTTRFAPNRHRSKNRILFDYTGVLQNPTWMPTTPTDGTVDRWALIVKAKKSIRSGQYFDALYRLMRAQILEARPLPDQTSRALQVAAQHLADTVYGGKE